MKAGNNYQTLIGDRSRTISIFYKVVWTLYFIYAQNLDFRTSSVFVLYGMPIILFITYVFFAKFKIPFSLTLLSKWMITFFFVLLIGSIYTPLPESSSSTLRGMIILMIAFYVFSNICSDARNIQSVLYCYITSTLINSVYLYSIMDFSAVNDEIRIGLGLELWNANAIGMLGAISFWIASFLLSFYKNSDIKKVFLSLCAVDFLVLTFLSGSRTALIFFGCTPLLYLVLTGGKKKLLRIAEVLLIVLLVYFLLINIPFLYNVIGYRIEGALDLYLHGDSAEGSAAFRLLFIQNGFKWFKEKPIFGHGTASYAFYNNLYLSIDAYSHNNFVELLVNHGLIGFVIYYYIYAVLIYRLGKQKKSKQQTLILSLLIMRLISHYGSVAYYSYDEMFILLLASALAHNNIFKNSTQLLD